MDMEDMTGKPPSLRDVEDAIEVVRKHRVDMKFTMANPMMAVNLGNIARCLEYLRVLMKMEV